MATWREFTLDSVQTAIFTPELTKFSAGGAVRAILNRFGDVLGGPMQVLPLPNDVPAEVPRVFLQSDDGRRKVNLGPARFDSLWNAAAADEQPQLVEVARQCVEVQTHYVRESSPRVGRMALVAQRIYPVDDAAGELIRRFCNEASQREPLNRSANFEIHNHKVYPLPVGEASYSVNSWVRCKSAQLAGDGRSAILVEQDLNTLAEDLETANFDAEQIEAFFVFAAAEADAILSKYFPEQALA